MSPIPMKRLSRLLTLVFFLIHLNSQAQSDIQRDARVNLLLKQVDAKRPGLMMFSRKDDKAKYVNMAVLSDSTRMLTWFTCYGQAFDSAKLTGDIFSKIKSGTLNPFNYYKDYFFNLLSHIWAAATQFRQKGKAVLNDTDNIYHRVYTYPPVQQARSTLQKEVAMENLMSSLYLQHSLFDNPTPQHLTPSDSFQHRLQLAGKIVRNGDTTNYYNTNPLLSAARIMLYKQSPGKMFVYDRQGQPIDSVPLKENKYASLLNDKEDVFLLYRGWLELQSQQAISGKEEVDRLLNREYAMLYKPASWEQHKQQLQQTSLEVQKKIDAVGSKVLALILPSPDETKKLLAAVYRDKPAEISYIPGLGFAYSLVYFRGQKHYELTNHLGNVLAVVSDKKRAVDENGDGNVEYYNADIVSAVDYLPFGAQMPGRTYSSNDKYRYGFNGKENDNEIKGEGNQQDYGMRIYDPRLGRFLSVDPLTKDYPRYTPYQFAGNNPVKFVDMDGLEPVNVEISGNQIGYKGGFIVNTADIYRITYLNLVLGFKLPTNMNTGSNPYDDGDPYNRDTWQKAFENVSYFFSHHAPAYSRSEAATKTIYKSVVSALFSGNEEDAQNAIAQIDKSENYTYRNSIAKDGLFYGSLVNDLRLLTTKAIFKSNDKIVQSAIDGILKVDPTAINAVEVVIRNPVLRRDITDFDIVMKRFIIEVTGGKGGGKAAQIETQQALAPNKEIVLFGPRVGGEVEKNLRKNNVKLFKKVEDLVKYVTRKEEE